MQKSPRRNEDFFKRSLFSPTLQKAEGEPPGAYFAKPIGATKHIKIVYCPNCW